MQTNYTAKQQNNKRPVEGILLTLLFIFGMLGFIYAFSNKSKANPEKVVTLEKIQESQNRSIFKADN